MTCEFKHDRQRSGVWIGLLIPLIFTSCRVTSQSVLQSQELHDYDRLNIIYRADCPTGPLFTVTPKDSSRRPATEIVQTAAEVPTETAPFQELSWAKAELRIECPHPDGRRDFARVTLHALPVQCGQECDRVSWSRQMEERMSQRQIRRDTLRERLQYSSQQSNCTGTVMELDLPRSELDSILAELNSHGFFSDSGSHSSSPSRIEVRLNRRWTSKGWGYEPALDELTTRVYEQGTARPARENEGSNSSAYRSASPFTLFGRSQ